MTTPGFNTRTNRVRKRRRSASVVPVGAAEASTDQDTLDVDVADSENEETSTEEHRAAEGIDADNDELDEDEAAPDEAAPDEAAPDEAAPDEAAPDDTETATETADTTREVHVTKPEPDTAPAPSRAAKESPTTTDRLSLALVVINEDGSVDTDDHAHVLDLRSVASATDPHAVVDQLAALATVTDSPLRKTTVSTLTDAITAAALKPIE